MPSQIDQQVKKNLKVAFNANIATSNAIDNAINAINDRINAIDNVIDELAEVDVDEDIVNIQDYVKNHKTFQLLSKNFNASEQSSSNVEINSKIQNSLNNVLQIAHQKDEIVNSLIAAKQCGQSKLPIELTKQSIKLSVRCQNSSLIIRVEAQWLAPKLVD